MQISKLETQKAKNPPHKLFSIIITCRCSIILQIFLKSCTQMA